MVQQPPEGNELASGFEKVTNGHGISPAPRGMNGAKTGMLQAVIKIAIVLVNAEEIALQEKSFRAQQSGVRQLLRRRLNR